MYCRGTVTADHGSQRTRFWAACFRADGQSAGRALDQGGAGLHVPEVDRNPTYFTYAAKGHLQLSRQGELLISYVVNSHEFGAMFKDATIYRPRFISIPLPRHAGKW